MTTETKDIRYVVMTTPDELSGHVGYQQWLKERAEKKMQLPPGAYNAIKRWLEAPPGITEDIEHTTFVDIVGFFEGRVPRPERFKVACADYGYTKEELMLLLQSGKSAHDVAAEIIARGMDNSD